MIIKAELRSENMGCIVIRKVNKMHGVMVTKYQGGEWN